MRVKKPTYTRNGKRRKSSRWHVHVKIRGRWERLAASKSGDMRSTRRDPPILSTSTKRTNPFQLD